MPWDLIGAFKYSSIFDPLPSGARYRIGYSYSLPKDTPQSEVTSCSFPPVELDPRSPAILEPEIPLWLCSVPLSNHDWSIFDPTLSRESSPQWYAVIHQPSFLRSTAALRIWALPVNKLSSVLQQDALWITLSPMSLLADQGIRKVPLCAYTGTKRASLVLWERFNSDIFLTWIFYFLICLPKYICVSRWANLLMAPMLVPL